MRRAPLVVLFWLAAFPVFASLIAFSTAAGEARFRFGTRHGTLRPTLTFRNDSRPDIAPGVSAWVNCGVALTPGTTNELSLQVLIPNAGGAIVGWSDRRNGNLNAFAARLDGNGDYVAGWTAGGNPISVSDSSQVLVGAGTDNAGGGLFLYVNVDPQFDNPHDPSLQRLTSSGVVAGGYPAGGKTLIAGAVGTGGMVPDGSGGLFFGWSQPAGSNLRVTRLDGTGAATGGWPANGIDTGLPDQLDIAPALDGSGGFYLAFSTGSTVNVQRYSSTGVVGGWPAGGVVVYSPGMAFGDATIRIIRLSNGDALVAWVDPLTSQVFAQRVNAAGTVDASWPAAGRQVTTSTEAQDQPQLAADAAGGALILWSETTFPFPFGKLYVQRLTATGGISAGWPATGAALLTSDTGFESSLVSDGADGAIAAWTDLRSGNDADIYAQRVLASGAIAPGWPTDGVAICAAAGDQPFPQIATDGAGGAIVSYQDYTDMNQPQLRVSRLLSDGTVSALASLVDAAAEPGRVRLHWYTPDGSVTRATVERAEESGEFVALGEILADGEGHLRFEDLEVEAGTTYRYRLAVLDGAETAYLGQVTVRVPSSLSFGIAGLRPNPAEGEASVVFTLDHSAPARLELLDIAGRRVLSREVGMLGAGLHVLRLEPAQELAAGIYMLRLTQSGRVAIARAAIVR